MLPDGAVDAQRIWKRFRADRRPTTLRDRLELSRRRASGGRGWRWALRDVDFHVEPGESVGLIGTNGSGKSTLLKILTGVMDQYAGSLEVGGRVGALIEVRSGLHAQLTGRQNVYVYGALIGLTRREVERRFDEIIAFADLEAAIDRPVKFFSTGMQMRLGFAVAAFLDPDVMLVDEILAVGDAWFQQRCLDKLREILANGSTLVFVSHDLAAVESSCRRGVLLHDGRVLADGPVHEVLDTYRLSVEENAQSEPAGTGPFRVIEAAAANPSGLPVRSGEALAVTILLESDQSRVAVACLGVSEGTAAPVIALSYALELTPGRRRVECVLSRLPLPRGRFAVWFGIFDGSGEDLVAWRPVTNLDVVGPDLDATPSGVVRLAPVHVDASWSID
ncbi:MAG: ABC transporter ATP-binding protein [Acidimicrobiia bacterium]